jgi:hypothetical protein
VEDDLLSPADVLAQARAAGVQLDTIGDRLRVAAPHEPEPELLAAMQLHKSDLLEILRGDRCRYCSRSIQWSRPGAVVFADTTAAHGDCYTAHQTATGKRHDWR